MINEDMDIIWLMDGAAAGRRMNVSIFLDKTFVLKKQ